MKNLRIGMGIDAHPFISSVDSGQNGEKDRQCLVLGGVRFSDCPPLLAHSDGDVLIHALMDALLSAARLPSIGELFPDSASEYEGAESTVLLAEVLKQVTRLGFKIVDVDCVVSAKTPRIADYAFKIRHSLAELLKISLDNLGLKGTSLNGLGEIAAGKGVEAHVVVLLCQ